MARQPGAAIVGPRKPANPLLGPKRPLAAVAPRPVRSALAPPSAAPRPPKVK
jgi:hypothetical protein